MNILHFAETFSPTSETFIYAYVTELDRQGERVHVVTYRRVNSVRRPFENVDLVDWPGRWNMKRLWYRTLGAFGSKRCARQPGRCFALAFKT